MNYNYLIIKVCIIVLAFLFSLSILDNCLLAYARGTYYQQSSEDLWTLVDTKREAQSIYNYLMDCGRLSENVSFKDFEYIFVLTEQLCTMTEDVPLELALAMIAIESGFDATATNNSARGLMQLIPLHHSKRMEDFVDSGHQIDLDDFYDPRLNIATGLDYMDYILDETDGDVAYALMWYNQGPTSASKEYLDNLHISSYAKEVMFLSKEIEVRLGDRR